MKPMLFALLLLLPLAPAHAALRVFACEPEWAALLAELAGDAVDTYTATAATQDPHHIEARPSLIARVRRADLVVCTGAELEAGWLPVLLAESANPRVQPGQRGYFEAASAVTLAEKPQHVDRSAGDVHAQGNPHFHLDPRNLAPVAAAVGARLAELDPARAEHYRSRARGFAARLTDAIARWEQEAKALRGLPVVFQHANFSYLVRWLGLRPVGLLEPKPGLPPSAAHLDELARTLKAQPARFIVRAAYEEGRASEWLADRTGIRAIVLPYTVGAEGTTDLFSLFDVTLARLRAGGA